tara:strand:+ start:739 stop:930 length:192 start_codon:yes stop_codon:yes gene_type:complete
MSSNGDPGGNLNGNGFEVVFIVCVLAILTTEGINSSARSAKELGILFAFVKELGKINMTNIKQ